MKRPFVITNETVRASLVNHILNLPLGSGVTTDTEASRTLQQNAAQWPILSAFSQQLEWPVNGAMHKLLNNEYKDVLTAAFEKEVYPRIAEAFDGKGIVMLGRRTSHYGEKKFAEWLEFLNYAAAIKGIKL